MIKVQSSNIEAVSYEKETMILKVQFKGGTEYEYLNVPFTVVEDIIVQNDTAEGSVGKYLNQNVKGTYPVRRSVTRNDLNSVLNKLSKQTASEAEDNIILEIAAIFGIDIDV
jgi:hypothetical protein